MTTALYILVFGITAYAIIRVVKESTKGIVYSPDDEASRNEINSTRQQLKEAWNIDFPTFWVPLVGESSENICFFELDKFDEKFGLINLSQMVNSFEKEKIFSFNETKEHSRIEKLMIEKYSGLDIFYTNSSSDWVIYITHENTITFGGSELLTILKSEWTEFNEFVNPGERIPITAAKTNRSNFASLDNES